MNKDKDIATLEKQIVELKNKEISLQQTVDMYRDLAENLNEVLFRVDTQGIITYISPLVRAIGYDAADLIGHHFFELIYGDSIAVMENNFKLALDSRQVAVDFRYKTKSGHVRWARLSSRPLKAKDDSNKLVGVCGLVMDVTKQKGDEEKIQVAEKRYKGLFEYMSEGVVVYEAVSGGSDFIIKEFNFSAGKIEKLTRDEVIGKSIFKVFPGVKKCGFSLALKRVYETGTSEKMPMFFYEDDRIKGWRSNYIYRLPTGEIAAIYEDSTAVIESENILKRNYHIQGITNALLSFSLEDMNLELFFSLTLNLIFSMERFSFEKKGCILLIENEPDVLVMKFHKGFNGSSINPCEKVKFGKCLCGVAAADKKIYFSNNRDWCPETCPAGSTSYGNYCIPIISFGKALGVICLFMKEGYRRNSEDEDFLRAISNTIADVIERKRSEEKLLKSYEQLQGTFSETVVALSSVLEIRDRFTARHQKRVAQLSCAMAKQMGLSKDKIAGLRIASLLHDIGKLYVPAELLNKPGKLTKLEFELIKTHPHVSYTILKDIKFPWPVTQIVAQHHEKINGTGYPHKLHGDKMLIESKILVVADVVEAMVSRRPYRESLGLDKALSEIQENKGKLYDPDAVDACLKVVNDKIFKL